MPNFKGGKKYKSSKHAETGAECHEIDESQGQMLGRIIRVMGNRNMLLYCNDKAERIAHIRGGLRKKNAKLELGDIVLFSLRGEGMKISGDSSSDTKERGDILAKYERETHKQLKKMPNVNLRLFTTVETEDMKTRGLGDGDDFGFTFDQEDEEDDDDDEDGSGEDDEERERARRAKKMETDKKRSAARSTKMEGGGREVAGEGDDVDIDAI
jgi:translation initiation factor 1A